MFSTVLIICILPSDIKKIFPWFILGFVLMSIIASIFSIHEVVVTNTKTISKFLMVSALVVVVALLVEIAMGIV